MLFFYIYKYLFDDFFSLFVDFSIKCRVALCSSTSIRTAQTKHVTSQFFDMLMFQVCKEMNKFQILISGISENPLDSWASYFRTFNHINCNLTIMYIYYCDKFSKDKPVIIPRSICRISKLLFSLSFNIVATFRR